MPRRSFLHTPHHTPLEDQIRTCINCGGAFMPLYDMQEQCCIEGFERKEVAEPPLPPRPTAYTQFLQRKKQQWQIASPAQILDFLSRFKRKG